MEEPDSTAPTNPSPNTLLPSPPLPPPPFPSSPPPFLHPLEPVARPGGGFLSFPLRRPPLRVTSEYDSDSSLFFHKVSCKLFDSLAKLKLSFQNNRNGEVMSPQIGFSTKAVSFLYDIESGNGLVKGSLAVGSRLQLRASQDIKDGDGEVSMVANLADPSYQIELSTSLPTYGSPITALQPRAALRFPLGEVSIGKRDESPPSINAILKSQVANGVLTAWAENEETRLRYSYKDKEMTFIPTICFPSNALSIAFKRQFSPLDKLSYLYYFNSNDWNAVYKRKVGKDLKFKAGYDSEVRLGWASLWVGDEVGKAKTAPMKMKFQFMVQVPQDDIANANFMFRVKKRWDF